MAAIEPERPHETGVAPKTADATREEGARVLADQAREALQRRGFTDQQLREWAETYIAEHGSGDVGGLIRWIESRERETA